MTQGRTPTLDLKVSSALPAESATEAAIVELRRRLIRLAVKLVWNTQDAEEIVQDAFKLALTAGPRLPHDRYEPWMCRTVTHLCLNRRRRRRPQPLSESIDLPHDAPPDARIQRAEQLDRLRQAIAKLPDRQRVALVLRTMQQMSYLDVAEVMALSVSAVRAHVHFARRRLLELLGAESSEGGS